MTEEDKSVGRDIWSLDVNFSAFAATSGHWIRSIFRSICTLHVPLRLLSSFIVSKSCSSTFVLLFVQRNTARRNHRQVNITSNSHEVLQSISNYSSSNRLSISKEERLTVCLSPKNSLALKNFLEILATTFPSNVISALLSSQSPLTSNSTSFPSAAFLNTTTLLLPINLNFPLISKLPFASSLGDRA